MLTIIVAWHIKISAPKILMGGAAGHFIAGGSSIKLNGGPVTVKASAIKLDAPAINKSGASLKIG